MEIFLFPDWASIVVAMKSARLDAATAVDSWSSMEVKTSLGLEIRLTWKLGFFKKEMSQSFKYVGYLVVSFKGKRLETSIDDPGQEPKGLVRGWAAIDSQEVTSLLFVGIDIPFGSKLNWDTTTWSKFYWW
jgi:hypothetical protein